LSVFPAATARDIASRLSLVYAAIFFTFGMQLPFLPIWLGARGIDDRHIAIILATPQFLRVLSTPLVAGWADRRGDFVGTLAASLTVMTGLFCALTLVSGFESILVTVTLFSCAQGVAMPLADALTFAVLRARTYGSGRSIAGAGAATRLEYGGIRKWGSAAFIGGNIAAGLILSRTGVAAIPYGLAASALLSVGAALYAAPLGALAHAPAPAEAGPPGDRRLGLLFLVIGAATLIQASHALLNTFGSLHWAREGYSDAFVGALWALGVISETTFFGLAGRWFAGPDRAVGLLALGGLTASLRWLAMADDPGTVLLALAQVGHGFSFASTHMGAMYLIFELAPHAMRARAQGWLNAAIGGASATVVALAGPLYVSLGERAYFVMAGFAVAGVGLAAVVQSRRRLA
jgi:PPP family 3-phenylpropionic acid transporter